MWRNSWLCHSGYRVRFAHVHYVHAGYIVAKSFVAYPISSKSLGNADARFHAAPTAVRCERTLHRAVNLDGSETSLGLSRSLT
jgi:hypothetical protein